MKTSIIGAVFIVLVAVAAGAYVAWYASRPVALPTAVKITHLSSDAYPLYNGFSWGAEHTKTLEDLSGHEVTSAPITDITNLSAVFLPFENYYQNKLQAAGWTEDMTRAADGPGSSLRAYKKGDAYIVLGYTTQFKGTKPNEPVQCPCDISFSVFSGSLKP